MRRISSVDVLSVTVGSGGRLRSSVALCGMRATGRALGGAGATDLEEAAGDDDDRRGVALRETAGAAGGALSWAT